MERAARNPPDATLSRSTLPDFPMKTHIISEILAQIRHILAEPLQIPADAAAVAAVHAQVVKDGLRMQMDELQALLAWLCNAKLE